MTTARGGLAIAELIFYVPAFFIALWVAFRHGFTRRAGWVFLVLLSLIRIIGSSCQLAAINKPSTGLIETALILSSVGISPLILAMLGLLSRVHSGMGSGWSLPQRAFDLLIIPTMIALILAIVGGTDQSSSQGGSFKSNSLTQAAIVIFVVMFFVQVIITIFSLANIQAVYQGDRRILIAVALSTPFFLVRLIYSLLATFDTSSSTFNLSTGKVIVEGFMSVFEEFMIVILYLAAGVTTPKLAKGSLQPEANGAAPRDQEAGVESQYPSSKAEIKA